MVALLTGLYLAVVVDPVFEVDLLRDTQVVSHLFERIYEILTV